MSKDKTLKDLNQSIRRCESTLEMLKQLPVDHEKRKQLLEQTEMDIRLLLEVKEKLQRT